MTLRAGLAPAEDLAIQGGLYGLDFLDATRGRVNETLSPFTQPGQQAAQQQAALSGALGPEAQATAFQQFQDSPGQAFLRDRGERAVLRNAAAIGGLGGGNVRRELVEFGQGLAAQDFQNQFDRLGQVAGRGLQSGLAGAGFESSLGAAESRIPLDVGSLLYGGRIRAGENLSSNIGGTSSALANLINQQGAGLADIYGTGVNNVNTLIQRAATGDQQAQLQLASQIANLEMGGAGMIAGQPFVAGPQTNYLGQLGQLASGVGGLLQATRPVNTSVNPYMNNWALQGNQVAGLGIS